MLTTLHVCFGLVLGFLSQLFIPCFSSAPKANHAHVGRYDTDEKYFL